MRREPEVGPLTIQRPELLDGLRRRAMTSAATRR
jgi:hypothetical protein